MIEGLQEKFEALELNEGTKSAARSLFSWLERAEFPGARFLAGTNDATPSQKEIKELKEVVLRELDGSDTTAHVRALSHLIELGNCEGFFNLSEISPVERFQAEPSPFTPDSVGRIGAARHWRQRLHGWVYSQEQLVGEESVGALIVSAALDGGLVNGAVLLGLVERLDEPLRVVNGRSYVDLSLKWRGNDHQECRRWYPPPSSEMIFLRLEHFTHGHDDKKATPAKVVWPFVKRWFQSAFGKSEYKPRSWSEFLKAAESFNRLFVPAHVAAYQDRKMISHSLRPSVWARINSAADIDMGRRSPIETEPDLPSNGEDGRENIVETGIWAQGLWRALRGRDKSEVAQVLSEFECSEAIPEAMERLLVDWAYFLCTQPGYFGNRPAMSTVRQHLQQAGKRLAALSGFADITQFSEAQLEELYEEVLGDAQSLSQRQKLRSGLREFHHYLVKRYGAVSALNHYAALGGEGLLHSVDASLVTFDEYYDARCAIRRMDLDLIAPELPQIAELLLVLGFRCGFRRMEALRLRIEDFHTMGYPEILVRPYGGYWVKTLSSRRKSPVYALLEQEELELLKEWANYRKAQESHDPLSPALFAIPRKGWGYVPEEQVMPRVHEALRKATGDPSMRYHHLRHSCASWTLLRLGVAKHGRYEEVFPDQPITEAALSRAGDLQEALYGRNRPDLYAVAMLLGHSGPDVTLEHYIHTMDLLALACDPRRCDIEPNLLVGCSGLAQSTAYRLLKRGTQSLVERVRNNWSHRVHWLERSSEQLGHREAEERDSLCPLTLAINKAQRYLRLRAKTEQDRETLSERVGWSVDQCLHLEKRAEWLANLNSSDRRQSTYRHRFEEIDVEEEGQEIRRARLLVHREPRTEASKHAFEVYAEKLWLLLEDEPKSTGEMLDYFIANQWKTRTELIFHTPDNPEPAQQYLRLLRALGFSKKDIGFASFDQRERSASAALWKKDLGLTWRHKIEHRPPPNPESEATQRWLLIWPKLGEDSEGEDEFFGYRYLMVMAWLVLPVLMGEERPECGANPWHGSDNSL